MNDADLIAQAMKMGTPKKRRKLILQEFEPSVLNPGDDAITKMASKAKSTKIKAKARPLRCWTNSDFLNHMVKSLSVHGVSLARNSLTDTEEMGNLYDEFVRRIDDKMSNEVLRDYIDWWCSTYAARIYGSELYARNINQEKYLTEFVKIKFSSSNSVLKEAVVVQAKKEEEVNPHELYKMGGLPMLLLSKGIVISASVLREKGDANWLIRISNTLHDFSKEEVVEAVDRTTSGAPYGLDMMVDFVSIARPAIEYHRIKEYAGLNYRKFFAK